MSSSGSSTSDTDSMSSDSGIDSIRSSSSSRSSGTSDFMDLDEFFLMSKAAHISKRKLCHAVTVQNDDSAESITTQKDQPTQVKEENVMMNNSPVESDDDTYSSVSELTDTSEPAPGNGGGRCRRYVYNPVPIEKKAKRKFIPSKDKDSEYWNRRMKNNVAAKRSRDMRRQKEIEVNQRYRELEEENSRLKAEVQILQANALLLEKKIAEQNE